MAASIDSAVLKSAALGYLRYSKRLPIVCTEVGRWNADVLGISNTMAIEIEVKVSKADLKNEFKNKRAKHYMYAHGEGSVNVPSYFYILVPETLADEAVTIVTEAAPKAGVLAYDTEGSGAAYNRQAVRVLKRAKKLTDRPPSREMVISAMMRCSSEVCGLRVSQVEYQRQVLKSMDDAQAQTMRLVARAAGSLDFEDPDGDLDNRAQELAFCVEGIGVVSWQNLSKADQQKWKDAALRLLDADYVNTKTWLTAPNFSY